MASFPSDPGGAPPRLTMTNVSKSYGGVRAIRHADFEIESGSVHAIVGENGAGKSTLIKIIAGAERPDTAEVFMDGEPVVISSTADALRLGIQTVYQEPQLFTQLSVAENIFLGRELHRGPVVDWSAQSARVQEILDVIGLPAELANAPVSDLSIAQQQQVSIAKALVENARILILDEPSAILTTAEIEVLFGVVRTLVARGVSVIYISHRLDELFEIADTVTVMRDGRTISRHRLNDLSVREVAELMVGGIVAVQRRETRGDVGTAPAVIEVSDLEVGDRVRGMSLSVGAGEVVGLFGLIGCGADDVAGALYGTAKVTGGSIRLKGKTVDIGSPARARSLRIAAVPADRAHQGVFSFQSIAFNITIGALSSLSRIPAWVEKRREKAIAAGLITRLGVKTPSAAQPVSAMSGGNAQKVVFARQLVTPPDVLVLSEPTQGVDIGAKEEIHRLIDSLTADGTAVLMVSTDLGEILRMSDRILVIREGRIVQTFGNDATQVELLAAAAGAGKEIGA